MLLRAAVVVCVVLDVRVHVHVHRLALTPACARLSLRSALSALQARTVLRRAIAHADASIARGGAVSFFFNAMRV